ncbi:MAG: Fic family protein [Amphritea sp.]|nr:Fic family protein [Amphritea sp.]
MRVPQSPPLLHESMDAWGEDNLHENLMLILQSQQGPCDAKGRYLHWEKLRHLSPPKGYSSELFWLSMKEARKKISKQLPFNDKHSNSFQFCIPDSVMRDILWISENATGAIEADAKITDDRTKRTYLINSLIEEAISSSQLEGAATTRRVAKEMLRTGREPEDHSEKMILNNHKAMMFIREYKDEDLTPSIIFEIHKILTEGTLDTADISKAGAFREKEDDICVFSKEDVLLHVPPKASELNSRLQAVCDFANKVNEQGTTYIPPIIRAIVIHFMIGYDHPFVDGNGRTARALFYWMMAKEGYWLMEYISISRVIKKAPAKYMYAYLHTETDTNDVTYFIIHQLEVIKQAIEDLHTYLADKAKKLRETEIMLENSPLQGELNYRQLNVLKNAIKNPGAEYTINSHKTSHGVTYQTARTDLLKLSDHFNLLKKYKVGKKDVFISPANLREIIHSYKAS